jgi:hypothetical protein
MVSFVKHCGYGVLEGTSCSCVLEFDWDDDDDDDTVKLSKKTYTFAPSWPIPFFKHMYGNIGAENKNNIGSFCSRQTA